MPSPTTTTRRIVHVFLLLGLAGLMTTMLASHDGVLGGISNFLRGVFNKNTSIKSSVPDHHEMPNAQNLPIIKADLSEEDLFELYKLCIFGDVDKQDPDPVKDLLVAEEMQGHHEMLIEQMSPETKFKLNQQWSWKDFLFDLLQHREDTINDDIKLLQPIVFALTGFEYRQCAETCDFYRPYGESFYEPVFPDDPKRQQRYCSICHSEVTRVAKKKAESLLEGVSRETTLEGCWDGDGILHQPGGEFMSGIKSCACTRTRELLCTRKNFWI
jgi:hypothetical protein